MMSLLLVDDDCRGVDADVVRYPGWLGRLPISVRIERALELLRVVVGTIDDQSAVHRC